MKIACTHCGQHYEVGPEYHGKGILCNRCGNRFSIPDEMTGAERLEDSVNTLISRLTLDNQDGAVLRKMYDQAEKLLTREEKIEYIALQKKLFFNFSPDALVLTNRRVILLKTGVLGQVDVWDTIWRNILDARIQIGVFRSTIILNTSAGDVVIENLLKTPASRAYAILQEQEERTAEERRQREIEETRAASGGVIINTPSTSSSTGAQTDCTAALKQLKELLDNGLITQGEYEAKRQAILSRL